MKKTSNSREKIFYKEILFDKKDGGEVAIHFNSKVSTFHFLHKGTMDRLLLAIDKVLELDGAGRLNSQDAINFHSDDTSMLYLSQVPNRADQVNLTYVIGGGDSSCQIRGRMKKSEFERMRNDVKEAKKKLRKEKVAVAG